MYKRSLVLWCVLMCACLPASAQDRSVSPQKVSSQSQITALVTGIEVNGNKSISANVIISKMKTKVGSPYQENIVNDDLKRLYLLGFFSDVKIDTQAYQNGLKVIVNVIERPIIEKIAFTGIKRLGMNEKKLKDTLKSKETQYLDYPSVAEDVKTLTALYEKKGFSQAQAEYKVDVDKNTNKARIKFSVVEGKKIRVKKIFVEGNMMFADARIKKLMKTKEAWLFNAGVAKEEVLQEDLERIKSFYHRQGYVDVEVGDEMRVDPKRPFLYITIRIKEGNKYLVGAVAIKGNKDISEDQIRATLKECTPGKVFSQEAMKEDIGSIQSLYFDKGYISMMVQESSALDTITGRIDITYTIVENEIAYVDKIKIRGNNKTKDVVVRRELRIRPGDKFDGEKLRRSKERLQNLGFFEDVSYDTEDTESANKKDLIVDVKETKTGSFSFGGGYSTVDQFIGFAEIEQKNFDWKNWPYFTGAGQDLKLRFSIGSISDSFDLSFTEPWMFDYPVSFGFDAYRRSHERESDVGYGYDEDIAGGDLRLGKEISEYLRGDLKYRFDNIDISNIDESASQDLKDEAGSNNISSMELILTYDSRNNAFDPVKGDLLNASIEGAGGPFGGDKDFIKFFTSAIHYFPLWNDSALSVRGRMGIVNPYGNSEKVPIYERFFAGGAYTVRGYEERKVGPVDSNTGDPLGGESMLIGSIEYDYPLLKFLKLAAFYDVGNVWSKASDVGQGGFKSGVGVGVRVKTPLGPLLLDYGIPLNKASDEEDRGDGRFHFSMSHGF